MTPFGTERKKRQKQSQDLKIFLTSDRVVASMLLSCFPILAMGIVVDIVTGASQGIGKAIAESIAAHRGEQEHLLVLVGRNAERGAAAAQKLGSNACFESCNLGDYSQVLELKNRIHQKANGEYSIGILVNDAAECPRQQEFCTIPQRRQDTGDIAFVEVDRQFATNVLGYHFMIKVFSDHFSTGDNKPTHVVNVASNWAGDLDLSDLSFKRRGYDNDSAYRQAKQCDRMLSKLWSEKLPGVKMNSCHPGDPKTTLSKDLGYNLWASAPTRTLIEQSTPIPLLCGFGKPVGTGGWYEGTSETPRRCRFASLGSQSQKLFDICESFCVTADTK